MNFFKLITVVLFGNSLLQVLDLVTTKTVVTNLGLVYEANTLAKSLLISNKFVLMKLVLVSCFMVTGLIFYRYNKRYQEELFEFKRFFYVVFGVCVFVLVEYTFVVANNLFYLL